MGAEIGVMWPQAKEIYSLTSLKVRNLKTVSLGQDVYSATFPLNTEFFPCLF